MKISLQNKFHAFIFCKSIKLVVYFTINSVLPATYDDDSY